MNFVLYVLGAISILILPVFSTYSLTVTLDNTVINSITAYTFTFVFADSAQRTVTLNFPTSSDISSNSLAIFVNNNINSLVSSSGLYSVDNSTKKIIVNAVTPVSNILTLKATNIINPPSAEQFSFITQTSFIQSVSIVPYINYDKGNLVSCNWKFDKFTGSTNSTTDIDIVLGNRLLNGISIIDIRFPNFQDSGSKYLTLDSTPTVTYSIDNGVTYLNPLASPVTNVTNAKITFAITSTGLTTASSHFKIKITGIVNPTTTTPTGKNFNVSTYDSSLRGIDKISQCTIDPVNVLELSGIFSMTALKVGDNYSNPKISINSLIPFTIFQYDTLELDHDSALTITSASSLQISFTRGSPFVSFYVDSTQPATSTSKYFKGNLDNSNEAQAYSDITFIFDMKAPYSQKPWDFVVWLKRPTGAYVKIKATLQAYAISIDSTKVSILAGSSNGSQMAVSSQYTLNVQLERSISKNGKLMLGFHSDYDIKSGPCSGYNGGAQITSTSSCDMISKVDGSKWLVYKIGETSSTTLDPGTKLQIIYNSSSIRNPLYPNNYTFRLEIYYTELDDSLVEKASIFGNIIMTKHYSLKASLVTNDFFVYESASLTISYTNDVYIPINSILQFILPTGIISFEFLGKITINSVDITNSTLDKNFVGGKTGQITIKQDINPGTVWGIPLTVKMPVICGDYPTITFRIMKSSVIYQQVDSGLQIRVKKPSSQLSTVIEPKTNNLVSVSTDYLIRIQSRIPLSTKFFVLITLPTQVKLGTTLNCISNKGTCVSILNPSPNILNLTLSNSPYTLSDLSQDFDFTVNSFINPRSEGSTNNWLIQLKGLNIDVISDISQDTTVSSNYLHSSAISCNFDQTKNYYKSNIEPVVIKCILTDNLIQGDYMEMTITSNAYTLNPGQVFGCTSPVLTFIKCENSYSSSTTLTIKVTILTNFSSDKNLLTLQISGLISNSDTTYDSLPVGIPIKRLDENSLIIDEGTFYYDISCNQNTIIKSKACKTCSNGVCLTCFAGMYLSNLGTCVRDCPVQTQYRQLNNLASLQCDSCASPCYTCQLTATTCYSCINSTYYLYLTNHTCQIQCDTSSLNWINTVSIPGQKICDQCLIQCKRCTNNTYQGCLECQSGFVLQNGACRNSCIDPRSYIRNGLCVVCNAACQTCNGSGSNNCIQCKQLYYMNNGYCVATCPSNKYPLPNGTCGCQSNCATCSSVSPIICSTCIDSTMFIYNGSCFSNCPAYTYMSSTQCLQCSKNCYQCTNSVSCLKCGPGSYIYESTCFGDCNSISYQYDFKDNTCVLCPSGCDKCNDTICTACLDGYAKNGTQCIKQCLITNTCNVKSVVPDTITPVPATIAFFVWVAIVFIAKWFNPKIYAPYSIVFLTCVIQYFLIIGTLIYSSSLTSQSLKRLLTTDVSQRPIIIYLLIVALAVNYIMNIIFAIIFYKYFVPLITAPRQIDYITIGLILVIGMLTNYRFCLIFFGKMFPKPRIQVEYSSRLTPIHYLCITSLFLSGLTLGAAGIIIKNQYPLTDLFMLGIDILIIEVILILLSIWMVAVNKNDQYFENDVKKYHLEENYRTEQNVLEANDQKNITKHHLNMKDQFNNKDQQNGNAMDETNEKRLLERGSTVNISNLNIPESDNQLPLQKRQNRIDLQKIRVTNKVENSFDTDISELTKFGKVNKSKISKTVGNEMLKPKQKQNLVQYDKKATNKIIFDSSKKFQTSDQDNMPKTIQRPQNDKILAEIHEPSSDQIPNLPLTNSIFHQRASSEFGQKIKPRKAMSNRNEQKSQIIKKKTPISKTNELSFTQNSSKSNMMKKKNKFFESQIDGQIPQRDNNNDNKQVDIQSIIRNRIIVIQNKDQNDDKLVIGDAHNISSIQKKDQQNSQFNDQVSPSWFNIQNQRFDISSMDSDFSEN